MNTSYLCFAGIDVSKDFLDVHLLPSHHAERFPNSAAGQRALAQLLKTRKTHFVVLESTGGYENAAVVTMVCAGLRVHVAQPQIIHAFAVSQQQRAKTDQIDAELCALFAQARHDKLTVVQTIDPKHESLRWQVARRHDLVEMQTQEKNRLQQAELQGWDTQAIKSIKRVLKTFADEIEEMESAIDATIKSDEELKAKAKALRAIKGVGPQSVRIVIALLPELGRTNDRRLSSLVGVAPYAKDSGAQKKKRHIIGGRMPVRNVLYMACLTASRTNPVIAPYYQAMRERGLSHKSAMMACIRRLLAHMNSKVRQVLAELEQQKRSGTAGDDHQPLPGGEPGGLGAGGEAPKRKRRVG